jgi:hypothetical protein
MNEATLNIANLKRRTALKGFVQGAILAGLALAFGSQTVLAQTSSALLSF